MELFVRDYDHLQEERPAWLAREMIEGTRSKDERTLAEFERRVHELSRLRKKPIVVLYYSPYILDGSGGVEPHDAKYLQNHCRAQGSLRLRPDIIDASEIGYERLGMALSLRSITETASSSQESSVADAE